MCVCEAGGLSTNQITITHWILNRDINDTCIYNTDNSVKSLKLRLDDVFEVLEFLTTEYRCRLALAVSLSVDVSNEGFQHFQFS